MSESSSNHSLSDQGRSCHTDQSPERKRRVQLRRDGAHGPSVSIVIATYARLERLRRCLAAVRANVKLSREIIVVGGGAGDGTEDWLGRQADVRFIRETKREGATRAYNKGFCAATGTFVMWLNDDAYPLPGSVEAAVRMIEHPVNADAGMVAFYHNFDRRRNRLDSIERDGTTYSIFDVRGTPYANFGLLRRGLLRRLNYLDERYYFCAWDPDLSLKVQRVAGLAVVGCRDALVYHEELIDDRKKRDMARMDADNAKLFAKWNLPEKFSYPSPVPAYRHMLQSREEKRRAWHAGKNPGDHSALEQAIEAL